MKLSNQSRLAALERIRQVADMPVGLTMSYPDPDDMTPEQAEQAAAARRKMAAALYPDFDPDTGEPLTAEAAALLVKRL